MYHNVPINAHPLDPDLFATSASPAFPRKNAIDLWSFFRQRFTVTWVFLHIPVKPGGSRNRHGGKIDLRVPQIQKQNRCCFRMSIAFFPQQPERLGVLPIKLRGGLGQPPETLHQVPRGSEGMEPIPKWRFHSWNVRFREVPKSRFHSWNVRFREVPKWRFHSWNVRFREVPKWRFHSWNVRFREVPKWRFHSWNFRFREVLKSRFHSWNVRFWEVPKSGFHSWNVRFQEVPKSRFHSWNVRFREVPKSRFHSWNVRFREVPKWRFHSWNVRFREVPKWRLRSWNVRFREVPKWRFHSWNVRFREVPKWRFHSWNVRFREVPKWRFHSWNVRFREVPKSRFHSWNVRFRKVPKSIHETLGHFSKYGMCLHITCFVFHIACFLFHLACFLLLIICQSEKQFLSTSCWGFHMGLFCVKIWQVQNTHTKDKSESAESFKTPWGIGQILRLTGSKSEGAKENKHGENGKETHIQIVTYTWVMGSRTCPSLALQRRSWFWVDRAQARIRFLLEAIQMLHASLDDVKFSFWTYWTQVQRQAKPSSFANGKNGHCGTCVERGQGCT